MPQPPSAGESAAFVQRVSAERSRLIKSLPNPAEHQAAVLADLLKANSSTVFGQAHGLDRVRGIDEFRSAVPIRNHEDFDPWLEQVVKGDRQILTTDDPLLLLSSSGTTGREKRIPVTRSYLQRCFLPFYFAGWAGLLAEQPDILRRSDAVLNLWQDPRASGATSPQMPHLGLSQLDFGELGEGLAVGLGNRAPWSVLPEEFAAADLWERAYLRLRLAAEHDVRCVIAVNPAIAVALPYQLGLWWPRLVEEIGAGTLGGLPFRKPDLRRARAIERATARGGTVRPCDLWPGLETVLLWTSYIAGVYLPTLAEDYGPRVRFLPAPIGSAEGPLATPLSSDRTAGPLMVSACLYEFVPAEADLMPDSRTLLAHELEQDHEYHVVLSHIGGLYRCSTRDLVRVIGFEGRTPRVEFAGRSGSVSAAGEEISEPQVLHAVARTVAETGIEVRNLSWRATGDRHQAVFAFGDRLSDELVSVFSGRLDTSLAAEVPAYRSGRSTGRLGPVRVDAVPQAAFLQEWRRRVESGERPPRVKDHLFQRDDAVWRRLQKVPPRNDLQGQ